MKHLWPDRGVTQSQLSRALKVMVTAMWLGACATQTQSGAQCEVPGGQSTRRTEPTQRTIERVERGLLPLIALRGVPDSTFSLSARMERYAVPGVSIAVIDAGAIEWSRAYGLRRAGEAAVTTDSTLFQAGSISKSVAAVTALRLVERGLLALDADVNRTLRSWRVPVDSLTRDSSVTLRRLLSHTAGFNLPSYNGYEHASHIPTMAQLLAGAAPANTPAARVEVTPGTEWRYSGAGMEVVRQLIEDASGRPYEHVATDEVLRPSGMCQSTFSQRPDTMRRDFAAGHSGGTPLDNGFRMHPELAAAGMWSTALDLARFGVALGSSRNARGGLLRQETMREALRPHLGHWGLGFALGGSADSATFGHDGSTAGFAARLVMLADGRRGVAVMTNGESDALIDEIQRSVATAYGWPMPDRPVRTVVSLDRHQLSRLAGNYRIIFGDRTIDVSFTVVDDRLAFVGQSGRPASLYAESPTRVFSRESGTTFTFEIEGARPARSVVIDQVGQQFVARRRR